LIHTFREPDAPTRGAGRFFRSALFPLIVIVVLVAAAGSALGSFTWEDAKGLGVALVFFAVLGGYGLLQERHGWCREIRLSDDGTCELETKSRVVRLHVNEIQSVKYSRGDESESYTIRYQGGKLHVSERIAGFADFLARLKTLNPAVDLIGFPADAWPDLHTPATQGGGTNIRRLIRSALFPLIVIALLVYLASQTFLGR
jgi:hypothetical protein